MEQALTDGQFILLFLFIWFMCYNFKNVHGKK